MTKRSVCAVIVTFHPTSKMIEEVPEVLAQVDGLVIVDNGSREEERMLLRASSRSHGFHLIENNENLGIAEALNQGIRWAKYKQYPWVLLLDQDSRMTNGFVGQMFASWECHPDRDRVASIHPSYVDPDTGIEPKVWRAKDGGPVLSMTSGAVMPEWVFDKIGEFASEYFIDWVDFEYCLRIRAAGYLIIDSRQAVLLHRAGNPKTLTILGFSFRPTHHSAERRYYLSRNRIAVYRKYFHLFPAWVLRSMFESLRETVKCFLGDQDRARKFRNFLLGTWDGLSGRMGKRGDL